MQNFPFLPFAGSPQPFSRHHADEGGREHVKPQPGRKDLCGDDCRNEDVGVRSPREPSSHLVRVVPRQEAVAEEAEEDECCNRPSGVSLRQTGKRQERRVWRHRIIPEAGVDADADGNLDEYWNKACRAIPQGLDVVLLVQGVEFCKHGLFIILVLFDDGHALLVQGEELHDGVCRLILYVSKRIEYNSHGDSKDDDGEPEARLSKP